MYKSKKFKPLSCASWFKSWKSWIRCDILFLLLNHLFTTRTLQCNDNLICTLSAKELVIKWQFCFPDRTVREQFDELRDEASAQPHLHDRQGEGGLRHPLHVPGCLGNERGGPGNINSNLYYFVCLFCQYKVFGRIPSNGLVVKAEKTWVRILTVKTIIHLDQSMDNNLFKAL